MKREEIIKEFESRFKRFSLASSIFLIILAFLYLFTIEDKIYALLFILAILVIELSYFYRFKKIKKGKFEIEEIELKDYWKEVNKLALINSLYASIVVSAAIMVYGFLTSEYLLAFIFAIIEGVLWIICAFVSKRVKTGFIIKKNGKIYLIKWK